MDEKELEKIRASIKRTHEWWNSLTDEEKQREADKSSATRVWEDWTEVECVAEP